MAAAARDLCRDTDVAEGLYLRDPICRGGVSPPAQVQSLRSTWRAAQRRPYCDVITKTGCQEDQIATSLRSSQ